LFEYVVWKVVWGMGNEWWAKVGNFGKVVGVFGRLITCLCLGEIYTKADYLITQYTQKPVLQPTLM